MPLIAVNGITSSIAREFCTIVRSHWREEPETLFAWRDLTEEPPAAERFLFCQGVLDGLRAEHHTAESAGRSFDVNFRQIAAACDRILRYNAGARIVVIGSESGFEGSYDAAYAGAKAALHLYVEKKRLLPDQQLVAIAPGIILDSGMTNRRKDHANLARRQAQHPKHRFLSAAEVARMAHFLLYVDQGFTTNTVIRMNGGEHAWR